MASGLQHCRLVITDISIGGVDFANSGVVLFLRSICLCECLRALESGFDFPNCRGNPSHSSTEVAFSVKILEGEKQNFWWIAIISSTHQRCQSADF